MANQAIVVASASGIPVMDDHCIEFISMSTFDGRIAAVDEPWQEWVLSHIAGDVAERVVILIAINLLIG